MHLDLLRNYLTQLPDGEGISRRTALTVGAGVAGAVIAATGSTAGARHGDGKPPSHHDFDDEFFDYANPDNLRFWTPSIYGADDERGALNEVTPDKTADALQLLGGGRGRGVHTFQLGELMSNGFPAFVNIPPRIYEQRLVVLGYTPPDDFDDEGGILQGAQPAGANRISAHEERFACEPAAGFPEPSYSTTYQIGTQLDNLNHVGAGDFFYNGFRGPDFANGWGTSALGAENMGPIVTRGVLLDVLGQKLAAREAVIEPASNGEPVLVSNYRITIDDLEAAMDYGRIRRIEAGDAVMIRTGWNQLLDRSSGDWIEADVVRWGAGGPIPGMPGIYLAEARWLAQFRPAIVGSDTWALEVLGSSVNDPTVLFPCHQELLMRHGIRIAESVVLDGLAEARLYEYVHIVTPQYANGATAGNTPPAALGVPRRRHR